MNLDSIKKLIELHDEIDGADRPLHDPVPDLIERGLLTKGPPNSLLLVTAAGHAYIDALEAVPLPRATWTVDRSPTVTHPR